MRGHGRFGIHRQSSFSIFCAMAVNSPTLTMNTFVLAILIIEMESALEGQELRGWGKLMRRWHLRGVLEAGKGFAE